MTEDTATAKVENGSGEPTELEQQIAQQVEYYFGDINLPRDRFLLEEMKKDNGWIAMSTMVKFNRLKTLSSDFNEIAAALRKSKAGLIEVSDDNQKLRRAKDHELPENSLEYWQQIKHRTVYVKGFPQEGTTLDAVQQFLKQFGKVENVVMRRTKQPDRIFKGSVFVTYDTRETCEAFVNNDVKQFEGHDLIKLMQESYWKQKQEDSKQKRAEEKALKQAKKNEDGRPQRKGKDDKSHKAIVVKGLVLNVSNLPTTDVTIDSLKALFKPFGDVGFVVFEKGQTEAQIRFSGAENSALTAWEKAKEAGGGKVMINDSELSATVLEGDAETKYWDDFTAQKEAKFARNNQNNRNSRGRGGRGGRGGGRGGDRGGGRGGRGGGRGGDRRRKGGDEDDGSGEKRPRMEGKGKKTTFNDSGDEGDDNGVHHDKEVENAAE